MEKAHPPLSNSGGEIRDIRGFERFLRAHGFSKRRARAIAAQGFMASLQPKPKESEELLLLKSLAEQFKV